MFNPGKEALRHGFGKEVKLNNKIKEEPKKKETKKP